MSAKDAPGEVKNNNIFDSPNISSSVDDIEEIVDKKVEEQKKRETVDIDGVPIEDKEIKYRASDIRKKKKMEYFVNVEGAEERAKAEEKKKEEEKKAIAKAAKDIEKEKLAEKADAEKKAVEERKKIAEVTKYINKQKTEKAKEAKSAERKAKSKKRNIIILSVIALLAVVGVVATILIVQGDARREEEIAAKKKEEELEKYREQALSDPVNAAIHKLDQSEKLDNELSNADFRQVDLVYDELLDQIDDDYVKARIYMDKANRIARYHDDETEQIIDAVDHAVAFAPDDLLTLYEAIEKYQSAGMMDKAAETQRKYEEVMAFQSEIHEQELEEDEDEEEVIREG